MSLTLRTITFRHDPTDPTTSALNIRRNKDFEVPVPEYDSAIPRPAGDQTAAWPIGPTRGAAVTIRVEFESPGGSGLQFQVRAIGGGILGKIDPFGVTIGAGGSAVLQVPLAHRKFKAVTRRDVTWRWEFRAKGSTAWQPLATTSHRVYLTLDLPAAPWNQVFADKHNPWTDLLDECCVAAAGSRTTGQAASELTERIHLGFPLKYDIRSGAPRYGFGGTGGSFALTDWIDYVVRGNAPTLPAFCPGDLHEYPDWEIVNCYDCAAALAIAGSVLGGALSYNFHGPFGYLEYVRPIGRGKCNNPFPGCSGTDFAVGPDDPRTGFGNHAYTKLGGKNFDACMREWVPWWLRFLLLLLWALILVLTLGFVNLVSLRLRADGWLIDLTQSDYAGRTIDVSQPFEASAAAGGAPAGFPVDFQTA